MHLQGHLLRDQLRQLRSERSSTPGKIESTLLVRESRSERSKDLQTTKSPGADQRTTSREQVDIGVTRVTGGQADIESLRSDHSVNSGRSTASLLEALIQSAQRNGEITSAIRLREKMVQRREATEKQEISYVRSENNATRSSNKQLSSLPETRTQRATSDSSQPHPWDTVDTDIHVRRDTVTVERPQQLRVFPEPPMRISQPPERFIQQSSNKVDKTRLHHLAQYRDENEELVCDSMIHGRAPEDRSGYVPLMMGVFGSSRHDEDHYQRLRIPPRFAISKIAQVADGGRLGRAPCFDDRSRANERTVVHICFTKNI